MRRILITTVLVSGCSLATVRGPAGETPPRCTRNARPPIVVDAMIGVTGILLAPLGFIEDHGMEPTGADMALGATVGAIGVVAAVSAIAGYRRSDACQQAWDAYEAEARQSP